MSCTQVIAYYDESSEHIIICHTNFIVNSEGYHLIKDGGAIDEDSWEQGGILLQVIRWQLNKTTNTEAVGHITWQQE